MTMWPFRKRQPACPFTDRRRSRPIPYRIARYHVPKPVLDATGQVMRRFGDEERECYVWWGGFFDEHGHAQVLTAFCPEVPSTYGCVRLTTPQLLALQARLRSLDQILLVELHTHPPGGGGQNEVDAAHPAATYRGFISIVVPNFASPALDALAGSHVYEYLDRNRWRELPVREIEERFVIEDAFQSVPV
jgi:hypothetical protein